MNGRRLHLSVIFLSLLAIALGSTAYAGGQVVTNGLVSWWKFDETTGAAAADSWSTNTGALNGGSVWTNGHINNALELNGTDGYVFVGDRASLKTPQITVESWVMLTNAAAGPDQGIVDSSGVDSWGGYTLAHKKVFDRWQAIVYLGNPDTYDGVSRTIYSDAGTTSTGVWTHLVMTCDAVTVKMYVNGVLQADSKAATNVSYATVGSEVEIGRYWYNTDCFNGRIDEVRIYNRALSAAEVQNNYYFMPRPPSGGIVTNHLVSWWRFEEGAGTNTTDAWGINQGTLIGGATWTNRGYIGGALAFNGIDGYVFVGDRASLKTPQVTVEAWVNLANKTNASAGWGQGIVDGTGAGSWGGYLLCYNKDSARWYAEAYYGNPDSVDFGAIARTSSDADTAIGVWTHLVLTCDGTNARMYVNGNLQASPGATSNLTYATVGTEVEIGRYYGDYLCFFGRIDEVRIYDAALSAAEVKQNYLATLPKGMIMMFK